MVLLGSDQIRERFNVSASRDRNFPFTSFGKMFALKMFYFFRKFEQVATAARCQGMVLLHVHFICEGLWGNLVSPEVHTTSGHALPRGCVVPLRPGETHYLMNQGVNFWATPSRRLQVLDDMR